MNNDENPVSPREKDWWTQTTIQTLIRLENHVKVLPAGQFLEPSTLNQILDRFEAVRALFLLQMELQGYKTEKPKQNNRN